jgi:hypothetical protein
VRACTCVRVCVRPPGTVASLFCQIVRTASRPRSSFRSAARAHGVARVPLQDGSVAPGRVLLLSAQVWAWCLYSSSPSPFCFFSFSCFSFVSSFLLLLLGCPCRSSLFAQLDHLSSSVRAFVLALPRVCHELLLRLLLLLPPPLLLHANGLPRAGATWKASS